MAFDANQHVVFTLVEASWFTGQLTVEASG